MADKGRLPAVLFVTGADGLGGSTRSLGTVLEHLRGRVWRVLAAPLGGSLESFFSTRRLVDEWIAIRTSRPRQMVAALRLAGWAVRNRGSLWAIHANGLSDINLAGLASRVAGVPLVVWVHDTSVSPWTKRLAPLWRRILPKVHWVGVSHFSRHIVAEAGLAQPREVVVIPNPIDPLDVLAEGRSTSAVPTITYLGGYGFRKGFHLLPELIRRLDGEDCRFLIVVNQWEPEPALAQVREELRAFPPERVALYPKSDEVRDIFGQTDIAVIPSSVESFGRVAAEAMVNGIPVVASDLEELRELIGDGGLLFPPGDLEAAAEALRSLVRDGALRSGLGAIGRQRVLRFQPSVIVPQLTALYGLAEYLAL